MSLVLSTRILLRNRNSHKSVTNYCCRCLCIQQNPANVKEPQDTIQPPTKLWRYVINKYMKVVDKVENKLEDNVPKVFQVYKTIKAVRYIFSDVHTYFSVTMDLWAGRELHSFTRKELTIYHEMPRDMLKILSLLVLASIPFIGNMFIVIGYLFPRTLFTHHLWNDKQKQEFNKYFHAQRISHYHTVLENLEKQVGRHTESDTRMVFMQLLTLIEHSGHPSSQDLLALKGHFETFPFGLDDIPALYYRLLAKTNRFMVGGKNKLKHDALLLLHIDRAMAREGFDIMTENEINDACLKRGLNPYGLSREEQTQFLVTWTDISQRLDEHGVSLLLHCPALLTYNAESNIQLMKGKRYRWRRLPY